MNPPEGLPPYPPVPAGFDRWVYRGLAWNNLNRPTLYAHWVPFWDSWFVNHPETTPGGYAPAHYLEAVRAEPELSATLSEPQIESSPTPETKAWLDEHMHGYDEKGGFWVALDDPEPFMERIERERDALKAEIAARKDQWRVSSIARELKAENGRLRAALELGREVMRQLSALANVNEATRGILRSTGEKFAKALAGKDAP